MQRKKRKLFKEKYFSELISRYHKQCIKNSWLTLNHTPYYHKELFYVLYNPSLENIELLLKKMDRMKFISYDGKILLSEAFIDLELEIIEMHMISCQR